MWRPLAHAFHPHLAPRSLQEIADRVRIKEEKDAERAKKAEAKAAKEAIEAEKAKLPKKPRSSYIFFCEEQVRAASADPPTSPHISPHLLRSPHISAPPPGLITTRLVDGTSLLSTPPWISPYLPRSLHNLR